ncbi:hypothetical protein [Streptomyces sp. NPDC007346]
MTETTHPAEDHGASAAEILQRARVDRQAQVDKDRARGGRS